MNVCNKNMRDKVSSGCMKERKCDTKGERESHRLYVCYERDSEWTWDRDTERVFTVSHYTPLSEWVRERERERERGRGGRLCRSQHLPLRDTWGVCLCERGWLDTECAWDRDMFFTLSQYISLSEWERERERRLCRSRYLQQRDVEKLCVWVSYFQNAKVGSKMHLRSPTMFWHPYTIVRSKYAESLRCHGEKVTK